MTSRVAQAIEFVYEIPFAHPQHEDLASTLYWGFGEFEARRERHCVFGTCYSAKAEMASHYFVVRTCP